MKILNVMLLEFVLLPDCSSVGNGTDILVSRFSVFSLPGKELLTFNEDLSR